MQFAYLASLVAAIAGLAVIDYRYKLAFFHDRRRTAITLAVGVILFSIWDLVGIGLHIFFPGTSPYVTGLMILPGYPIEELFFLTLLCYNALIIWTWRERP